MYKLLQSDIDDSFVVEINAQNLKLSRMSLYLFKCVRHLTLTKGIFERNEGKDEYYLIVLESKIESLISSLLIDHGLRPVDVWIGLRILEPCDVMINQEPAGFTSSTILKQLQSKPNKAISYLFSKALISSFEYSIDVVEPDKTQEEVFIKLSQLLEEKNVLL